MTARRDGRRSGQHIDWPLVRALYIEGRADNPDGDPLLRTWPTLADTALEFGISRRAVEQRASRDGWTAQRDDHQQEVDRRRRDALATESAGQVASIDRRGLANADAGLALVQHRMTFLVRAELERADGQVGKGVSAAELAALGLAARRWVQVKDAVTGRGTAPEGDELDPTERDLLLAERMLAARFAEHRAAREADESDLPD